MTFFHFSSYNNTIKSRSPGGEFSIRQYDIAIIGGGPAGATFAREVARRRPEWKIALVDEKPRTGSKVCGGLLAPDAQKVLAQFNLALPKHILADPQIFDVQTIDLVSGCMRHYQRHYLNMDRQKFDQWLLELIPPQVEQIEGRCIRITEDLHLQIRTPGGTEQISCSYLVGADGGSSIVRRTFFAPPKQQYVAIQEHYADPGGEIPPYSCIFDPETSDSCSWTIRKDGHIIFGGAFLPQNCREAFTKQRARLETQLGHDFGRPIKREACLLTSIRSGKDLLLGKRRIFLLGEAAGFVSPSSYEGFSSAFLTGKYLADAFCSGKKDVQIRRYYQKATRMLRWKLCTKILKMKILCSPTLRNAIMKSGIQSIQKYE